MLEDSFIGLLFDINFAGLEDWVSNPITIYEDQMLIEALHKMFNERVSSLAVIDRSRTLIGNISIVDVKMLPAQKFPFVVQVCFEFY